MTFNPSLLPKVELHVHLDTCLSYFYIKQLDPTISIDEFNQQFVAHKPCFDLGDFLSKVTPQVDILQTILFTLRYVLPRYYTENKA